ncbi:MAG: Fur family transcriptional regulator [Phycisphaerales bacterium JB058]
MSLRRDTAQQRAIREVIETAGRPLSVHEIHTLAQDRSPSLGLRTVYRVINRLTDEGMLVPVTVPGQPDRHELATIAAKHHHHFHCESCDRVFDVDACPGGLSRMLPSGFELAGHELSLWGRCVDCAG